MAWRGTSAAVGERPRLRPIAGEATVPPHNLDAEAALLGAMLLTHAAARVGAELLQAEDFYKPGHGHIFDAIVALHGAGQPVDPTTVADQLARNGVLDDLGGKTVLLKLQAETPAAAHAEHYASLVAEASLRRQMMLVASELADQARGGGADAAAILGEHQARLTRLAERQARLSGRTFISGEALVTMTIPEPTWVVPGYVAQGLSVLAGRPKIGKSWLALNLAVAVATGGRALGTVPVDQGPVLYLALEDTMGRLQRRLRLVLGDDPGPRALDFATSCPRLDEGGLQRMEGWLRDHPGARLVIVDTLAKVRPRQRVNGNLYAEDYAAMAPLKKLADDQGVAVMAVHHLRKGNVDDPLEAVSGTAALTGAADSALILRRDRARADAVLFVTGRDVEETEVALSLDQTRGTWALLGDADEYRRSEERSAILDLLREADEAMSPKEIADALDKPAAAVRMNLTRMVRSGELSRAGRGRYQAAPAGAS